MLPSRRPDERHPAEVPEAPETEYDEFPPRVRRAVLSEAYKIKARSRLEEHLWSARAVAWFARFARLADSNGPLRWIELVAAPFGRPGLVGARLLRDQLRLHGLSKIGGRTDA